MKFGTATLLLLSSLASTGAFVQNAAFGAKRSATSLDVTVEDIMGAQEMVDKIIYEKACGPIFVRLAWHDSGTHDAGVKGAWPASGGAIASIRFAPEINHGANNGLSGALTLLEPVKAAFPEVSYADLFQMASARSIETAGGPNIGVKYGRLDATSADMCSPEGNLPDAEPNEGKYGGAGGTASTESTEPEGHLRKVFYRMGINDEEIVALSGAHTFGEQRFFMSVFRLFSRTRCLHFLSFYCFSGRAYKDRSGVGAVSTKFTDGSMKQPRADGTDAPYTPGGSSWTPKFLIFDNSYYKILEDPDADPMLLKMSSDRAIYTDEAFRPFAEKFRDSEEEFFKSYASAHKKLSELGSKFEPAEGITLVPVDAVATSA
jgi:L-ascorbate peroxidase